MFKLIFLLIFLFLPATNTNSRISWKRHLIQNMREKLVQETTYPTNTILYPTNTTAKALVVAPEREAIVNYGVLSYTHEVLHWCKKIVNSLFFVQHSLKLIHMVKGRLELGCSHTDFSTNFFDVDLGYKQLATGELDILTEPVYVGLTQMDNMSILYPHDKDDLCFLVEAPGPRQLSLLLTVSLSIWLATAACVVGVVAAAGLGFGVGWGDAAFAVLGCLISGASHASLHRLCLWVSLLSFFLWNFIGGFLTGSIVSPGRGKEFRTLEEVDAAFKRIYAPPTLDPQYLQWLKSQSNVYASLISKFSDAFWKNGAFDPKEDVALSYETHIPVYKSEILDYPVIKTSVCLFTPSYMSFPVRKIWPHAKTFEKVIQTSVEAGLLKKLKQEACAQLMLYGDNKLMYCSSHEIEASVNLVKPVQLDNLKEAFVILGIGLSLAQACFLIENRSRILYTVSQGITTFTGLFRVFRVSEQA